MYESKRKIVRERNEDRDWEDLEKIGGRTNVGAGDSDSSNERESEKWSTKKRGDNQSTRRGDESLMKFSHLVSLAASHCSALCRH